MWCFKFFFLGSLVACSQGYGASWAEKKDQGWLWYRADPIPAPPAHKSSKPLIKPALTARAQVKKLQEAFEESTARAVLNPTVPNVLRMQLLQQQITGQATRFQESWMLASLLQPSLFQASDHFNAGHREIQAQQEEQQLHTKIKQLSKSWGLFFVFKQSCPFCHRFAPIVKELSQEFGFSVKAISPDGSTLAEFPQAVQDNGALALLNPQGLYPLLFLANPRTMEVIPLARGLLSRSELLENFKHILRAWEKKL